MSESNPIHFVYVQKSSFPFFRHLENIQKLEKWENISPIQSATHFLLEVTMKVFGGTFVPISETRLYSRSLKVEGKYK